MNDSPLLSFQRTLVTKLKLFVPALVWCAILFLLLLTLSLLVPTISAPAAEKVYGLIPGVLFAYLTYRLFIARTRWVSRICERIDKDQVAARRRLARIEELTSSTAEKIRQKSGELKLREIEVGKLREQLLTRMENSSLAVVALGGSKWEHLTRKRLTFSFSTDQIFLTDFSAATEYAIPFTEIVDINIGGPGTVTKGGGTIGGGSGVEGFLVGASAAALLNLLTTHTTTKTIVHFKLTAAELFLLISTHDPDQVRMVLSPIYVNRSTFTEPKEASKIHFSFSEEINSLIALRDAGEITHEQFSLFKEKLMKRD